MSTHYKRSQKAKQNRNKAAKQPREHIKTGLSALQKTIAIVASSLGIITALITITNFTSAKGDQNERTTTTIIKEVDNGENNSNDLSDTSSQEVNDSYTAETSTQTEATTSQVSQPTTSSQDQAQDSKQTVTDSVSNN